jgi:molecular chaperone GrpE
VTPGPADRHRPPSDDDLLEAAAAAEGNPAIHPDDDDVVDAELIDVGAGGDDSFGDIPVEGIDSPGGGSDLAVERDEYREAFLRVKADFENFKKRSDKQNADRVLRAAETLVTQLLPVLDASEAAISHGADDVEPIFKSMLDILEREGLERHDPVGQPFDPAAHEAVMHEEGDGGEAVVVANLRTGYTWKGRVIRPAMVKVKG